MTVEWLKRPASGFALAAVTLAAVPLAAVPLTAHAGTALVSVTGSQNPYLAGMPSGFTCCSGDVVPTNSPAFVSLANVDLGQAITFMAIGGFSNTGGTPALTADGDAALNMSDYSGFVGPVSIAGVDGVNLNGLVGVFLDNSQPTGAAPAFRNDGTSFTTLSPGLGQMFWIGDGLTGTGTGSIQTYFAPLGATRLFLGSTDGYGWANNTGTSRVSVNFVTAQDQFPAVPEPATWATMLLGFGLVGALMRRRAPHVRFSHRIARA